MKRFITEHFEERLTQRFGYNLETLSMDISKNSKNVLILNKDSKELKWYPQLKREFEKFPKSKIWVYESLGICIVTLNNNLITTYKL